MKEITNARERGGAVKQLKLLEAALIDAQTSPEKDDVFVRAHARAVTSDIAALKRCIADYDSLKQGEFDVEAALGPAAGIGHSLVRSRVAAKLTQAQLANLLGLQEQAVQRYEKVRYAQASLATCQQIASVVLVAYQQRFPKKAGAR